MSEEGQVRLTQAEVLAALLASGFVFEADLLRVLRRSHWHVVQSAQYKDTETGKLREMDLIATLHERDGMTSSSLTVRLIIECRTVRNGLILVGARRRPEERIYSKALCHGIPSGFLGKEAVRIGRARYQRAVDPPDFLDLHSVFPPFLAQGTASKILHIDTANPKRPSARSALPELLLPLAKAAHYFGMPRGRLLPPAVVEGTKSRRPPRHLRWEVSIPILFVRGPLWFYDVTSRRPGIKEIPSACINVEFDAGKRRDELPILVASEATAPRVLRQCRQMVTHCFSSVTRHVNELNMAYDREMKRALRRFGGT